MFLRDQYYDGIKQAAIFSHLNDNTLLDSTHVNKIDKVRPPVECLNDKFREPGAPNEHLSIDESVKGKNNMKYYNPMKGFSSFA